MSLRREIGPCDLLPRGYGLSYRKSYSDLVVCYPFPLNHLVAWAREAWWRMRNFSNPGFVDEQIGEAYDKGHMLGVHDGRARMMRLADANEKIAGADFQRIVNESASDLLARIEKLRKPDTEV